MAGKKMSEFDKWARRAGKEYFEYRIYSEAEENAFFAGMVACRSKGILFFEKDFLLMKIRQSKMLDLKTKDKIESLYNHNMMQDHRK